MIKLIDGKGQLGNALDILIRKEKQNTTTIIYHTWNFLDKSEKTQKECYEKFKKFVDENSNSKIVFISTYLQTKDYYTFYKQLSEEYLLKNNQNGYIVKLPTLIGKGICQKFRDNETEAFGEMEIITIEDAARSVLEFSKNNSLIKSIKVEGTQIPAKIVKNLILFGKEGK